MFIFIQFYVFVLFPLKIDLWPMGYFEMSSFISKCLEIFLLIFLYLLLFDSLMVRENIVQDLNFKILVEAMVMISLSECSTVA